MGKISALLLIAFLSMHLGATTYYVAKTGNDANPGTEVLPWLTIRHAANTAAVVAGDTVLVGPGAYDEGDTLSLCANAGTAGDPIVFRSSGGWNTTISTELYIRQKHVVLEGFRLVYTRRWASQEIKLLADSCVVSGCEVVSVGVPAGGVGILIGSGHYRGIRIIGNTVHGFNSHGIYASQLRNGTVTHNVCFENRYGNGIQAYPSVESSEVSYNRCYENGESGVLVHGYYNRIRYNICRRNGASGVKLYADDFYTENRDNEVANNTCFDNDWCGLWVMGHGPNLLRNNVCLGNWWCGRGGYSSQLFIDTSAAGNVTLDHNCYWPDAASGFHWNGNGGDYGGNYAAYRAATGQDLHGICADPLPADTAAQDFHLQATSPCIDAGDPTTPPGLDFDGVQTPQGAAAEMGAFEYRASTEHSDAGVLSIVAPGGAVDSGTVVVPRAMVKNLGSGAATFPVKLTIGAGYTSSQNVTNLQPGDSIQVSFATWTALTRGTNTVRCSTGLAGDQNHGNDTMSGTVVVRVIDVGASALVAPPDTVDSGASIAPGAWVRNYGTTAASFPVMCSIDSIYSDTANILNLAPGDSALVSFAPWHAEQRGNHIKRCSTALAGDGHPADDTLSGLVVVRAAPVTDVGVVSINRPSGTYRLRESVTPSVTVRNHGNVPASFDVWLFLNSPKGAYYSGTVHVANLGPANNLLVDAFRSCRLRYLGDWIATCSLALAGDTLPGNNVLTGGFKVGSGASLGTEETILPDLAVEYDSVPQPSREGVMEAQAAVGDWRLEISPNPVASGSVVLRYSLPKPGPTMLEVFDVTGRTVLEQSLALGRTATVSLDLRTLKAGVYLVMLATQGFTATQKLVVRQ